MQRVKNIEYDDDDYYSEEGEDHGEEEQTYTAEDRDNFVTLTPVVRLELDEAGLQASDREIEESLWHYYWDVGKSVAYLKNTRTPRTQQQQQREKKKEKAKSKFDKAAERSASKAGEFDISFAAAFGDEHSGDCLPILDCRDPALSHFALASNWFSNVPWTSVPPYMESRIIPAEPLRARPRLLGGSSKLAKLAEERRKKAAAGSQPAQAPANGALNSLDRLSKPKNLKENTPTHIKTEPKKYPIRKKREPTPPPKEPSPPPAEEPNEDVPDLRASPTEFARTLSTGILSATGQSNVMLKGLFNPSAATPDPFKGPSPDDSVLHAQQHSKEKLATAPSSLSKKTEALKIHSTPTSQTKIRSKGLDVPKLWEEQKAKRKASAAFVVIGHVDHGKSTLMGRLLLDTGAVAQRDIDKYKKQATELGKASFALAWVMDTGSEERERGVTVDIAQHHFSIDKVDFTILDAPGHRDFVPNMIGGASMADLAVLVVDATQLGSGMKGQTREHILLAKACGLKRIIVAVNKLDSTMPPWDESMFDHVKSEVSRLLTSAGFAKEDVTFVPCSGLNGQNIVNAASPKGETSWVAKSSPTLLQELKRAAPTNTDVDMSSIKLPLRMQISDVFRGGITNPLSISGRIAAGNVQIGDHIIVLPSSETATIKAIEVSGEPREWAVASQLCTLHLNPASDSESHLRAGDLLCSADKPVAVVKSVIAQVQALDSLLPQGVDVHMGRLHVPGTIGALITTVDTKGEVVKKKPRVVKAGQRANVKLVLDEGAPLEAGDRVVLRSNGSTVAAGRVERVATANNAHELV